MRKTIFLCFVLVISAFALTAQTNGTIRGTITDKETGEILMFTNVYIEGTDPIIGAQSDLDGNYEINVAPGTYDLTVSYTGYTNSTVTGVEVKAGEITIIDFSMQSGTLTLTEVVVQATVINRTENALLALQRKSINIQDGISSQEISRFGSSNAAESMKRVTGASVVGGKYVVVRGLGDRYSSAQLNGLLMPSTDPYRNSSPLDLIPANLIENVIASKTFSPNKPGSFTGGNIDIKTKSFPERFTMAFSVSTAYNDQSSFNDRFLTYDGGNNDWLGFDDGARTIPAILTDPKVRSELTPSLGTRARRNEELATLLDQSVRSLNPQMNPYADAPTMNYGINYSIGNQFSLFGNPLGVMLGVSYNRRFEHYDSGTFANWVLGDPNAPELGINRDLMETRSTENPQVGGLLGLAYKFAGSQKISFNFLYNHDAEKDSRFLQGPFPAILSSGEFQSRSISFMEREIQSYQVAGEHVIGKKGVRIDWSGGLVNTSQQEPDLRFFANSFFVRNEADTSYFILPSEYPLPFRFWRDLQDQQYIGKVDFTIPFAQEASKANKIEFGVFYQTKDRDFREDRFQYQSSSTATPYRGDSDSFFGPGNIGLLGVNPNNNRPSFGLFLSDVTRPENTYTGTETIGAAYGMITYDWNKLRIVAGVRAEDTDITVVSSDETKPTGNIQELNVLPSLNLIYNLTEDMNLRASYSNTLARPNMRELAPFSAFEFIGGFLYTGNPELKQTLVANYDLRWEWYPSPGEILAVSGYYKTFDNPIVQVFVPEAANKDEIQFSNVDFATVYGVEFEWRKNLDFLGDFFQNFKFISNFSLIHSEVEIPEGELDNIEEFNPEKGNTRPLQGQSPFLLNASLNYVNPEIGLDAILSINAFGTRLDAANFGGQPDVYEQTRSQLDFSVSKSIGERIGLKFSAGNLLNPDYLKKMEYKGNDFPIQLFRRGRTFSTSLSYRF